MIVNYIPEGWEIITQRAHGLLAAQLAFQWKASERPKRWVETVLAIGEHDDAQVELENDDLLTDKGGPVNYSMKRFELEHCQRLSRFSLTKSRYIALLTSIHMEFLHKGEAQHNEQAKTFLAEQKKLQERWQQSLQLSKEEVDKAYSLLEWCDAFSLLLCQRQVQPEHRSIEISRGPNGNKHHLYQVDDKKLTLDPWPFEASSFSVHFESRIIGQLQFKDAAEFRDAFHSAEVIETIWQLEKTKVPVKTKKV